MRTIHVNQKKVRIEAGCGVWPFFRMNCGVLRYAIEHSIPYTKTTRYPWINTDICVRPTDNDKFLCNVVQSLCDNCRWGELQKTKQR